MGKVEVAVECGGGPDFPGFDPPMVGRCDLDEIRLPPVLEEQGNVLLEGWLVAFDGEMVMRLPLPGHVVRQFALREQGVGTDDLAFDVDGIEQGDGGLDLVGLLDGIGIAADRQCAYFFWVWQALVWCPATPMMWVWPPFSSMALRIVLPSMARLSSAWAWVAFHCCRARPNASGSTRTRQSRMMDSICTGRCPFLRRQRNRSRALGPRSLAQPAIAL